MTMDRIARSASVLVALLALTNHAVAEEPTNPSDSEVTQRLQYIQDALDGGRKAANLWWYGWLAGYGALTVQQVVAHSGADTEKQEQDTAVGAVTSALGAIGQLAAPVEAGRLAVRLRALPGDTPEERLAKLATAESYLRRSAAQEEFGRSWKVQAITVGVNLGAGLFLWLHYDRPARDGLATFAIFQAISEVQIFTQPMKAVHDLREYERRSDFGRASARGAGNPSWYVGAAPGGFVAGCRF
jgi:hypothetical protein